jgi:hypothetical protein
MDLSKEQLDQVEQFAGIGYSPSEIADILGLDAQAFTNEIRAKTPARNHFRRGLLLEMGKVLEAVKKSAIDGSSPAQTLMLKQYENTLMKLSDED